MANYSVLPSFLPNFFANFHYFHNIPYANGLQFANVFSTKLPTILIHQIFLPPIFYCTIIMQQKRIILIKVSRFRVFYHNVGKTYVVLLLDKNESNILALKIILVRQGTKCEKSTFESQLDNIPHILGPMPNRQSRLAANFYQLFIVEICQYTCKQWRS